MSDDDVQFRITFKVEGDFENAYVAPRDSMDGAELIATMRKSVLDWSPSIKAAYRKLLIEVVQVSLRASFRGKP